MVFNRKRQAGGIAGNDIVILLVCLLFVSCTFVEVAEQAKLKVIICVNCLSHQVLYADVLLSDLHFLDLLCYMMYISVAFKAKNNNFAVINTIVKHESYEEI